MSDKDHNFTDHSIELMLQNITGNSEGYHGKASKIETIIGEYIDPEDEQPFLKDLYELLKPYNK
ncbi:hypothetical protein GCM10023116_39010 [Kistimonas scapharcae]|uniref:Uncharacterized protein n=1 Tax=Kistimonas scapharcae TaxID=1036133 RepID=A0ABP8V9H5_9GAMM